jgi:hypothetical protein
MARQGRPPQPLGDLVRTLPQGDAGADSLQKELGSPKFEVVAISIDRHRGLAGARKFLDETEVKNLAVYADPTTRLSSVLKAIGLPARAARCEGREIGRLVGPAEWDSEDAKRLIRSALK